MALSIMNNSSSLSIQNQLNRTNGALGTALERLGSGLRINSAKDDAAGLQIANRLTAQSTGQKAALYNSNNAMTMMQTADSAFDEMTNIADRMKELATQAANGTNSGDEFTAMDSEYQALAEEMASIMSNTSFGAGTKLLAGTDSKFSTADGVDFQVGSSTAETLNVDVSTQVGAVNTAVGSVAADGTYTAGTLGNLSSQANGSTAIDTIDTLINNIGSARSALGASMNRLDHTINNVTNMKEATDSAASNLLDADYAVETSNMSKQQLLMNSGVSVLSVSNSTNQMIASLLRG
ncbi:flagellin [Shewanella sp. C32]|uniref:Flagellin n=1 Tax=Shewanella electrica TaxID=515560 RepID=A0ABT2FGB5_9GAMM|nr:flagellin [Shewanella electrica]MCH1923260.1 Lateral flagellin [Shewanella electrica]MCS4555357.1 flagellin [Shewanella electrica]